MPIASKVVHAAPAIAIALFGLLAGCNDSTENEVTYYRHTDTVQCAPSATTQTNISALATALANAGVAVTSIRCGHDKLLYPAACGVWNGEWWLVSTVGATQEKMRSQGFAPASEVPAIEEKPCG